MKDSLAKSGPRFPPTDRSLPIALIRARERVMGPIREMLADAGVTEQQWRVLRVLDEAGPLALAEIGRRAALQSPSVTRIVQGLEERGLVGRLRDTADRRRQTISLTEAGAEVIYDKIHESRRITAEIERRLGPEKHRRLLDLLDELERIDVQAR
jgi:homoprotocatechuate degradation regulator HpaR